MTLITGFLGSGKTTLLQRLLNDPALADTAVLINEFGEIGLDHHLLERIDETMVMLQSGCVCCMIRGELSTAIRDLHSRRERGEVPPFRRLVIESTGLADPFPILSTVRSDPVLRHHFTLGNVVATVDAVNGARQLETQPESVKQVAVADRLVLTKTDLADPDGATRLTQRLRRINPQAPVWRSTEGTLDAATLLSDISDAEAAPHPPTPAAWAPPSPRKRGEGCDLALPPHDSRLNSTSDSARNAPSPCLRGEGGGEGPAASTDTGDGHEHRHHTDSHHTDGVSTLALSIDEAVDWTRFGVWLTMLLYRHGDALLRVKGILNVAGSDTPVAVHAVQHLVHPPRHMEAWPDAERRSRLVFIARGLDPGLIERSFRAFATA